MYSYTDAENEDLRKRLDTIKELVDTFNRDSKKSIKGCKELLKQIRELSDRKVR